MVTGDVRVVPGEDGQEDLSRFETPDSALRRAQTLMQRERQRLSSFGQAAQRMRQMRRQTVPLSEQSRLTRELFSRSSPEQVRRLQTMTPAQQLQEARGQPLTAPSDIGSPTGEAVFPGVVGKIPGLRTPPEAASTLGTAGFGSIPMAAKAGGLALGLGGAFGGGEAAEQLGAPRPLGEAIGGLGGGLTGGIAGPMAARRIGGQFDIATQRAGGVGGLLGEEVGGTKVPRRAPAEVPETPVTKLTNWLNQSKGALATGRKARQAEVAKLRSRQAGALSNVYGRGDLTPQQQMTTGLESLRGTAGETPIGPPPINESETAQLLTTIRDYPVWQNRPFKALNAQLGLSKLMNGELPSQSELGLLEQVFGPEFVKSAARASSSGWREVGAALGLPRTFRTIMDISFPLRQGIGVITRHPKEVVGAIPRGVKTLIPIKGIGERAAQQWDEATRLKSRSVKIVGDDGAEKSWSIGELQDEVGLFLPRIEQQTGELAERTEEFMATQGGDTWVGRIFGPITKPFQRNFITVGNATRSDIFENNISGRLFGFRGPPTMEDARALAWLINVGTGRGDLGALNRYAPLLAQGAFSPRLIAARLEHPVSPLLLATGAGGVPRSPKAAALAAQQLTTFIGGGLGLLATASQVPGLKIEGNPLSSKWGKIELGFDPAKPMKDTSKIDLFGGYQQYARFIAQLYEAKAKSDSGQILPRDRITLVKQFIRNKAAPNVGIIWDVISKQYGTGEKVDLETAAGVRTFLWNELSPLSINDIIEAVNRDDGVKPEYAALAPFSSLGGGVQTYGQRPQSVANSLTKYEGVSKEEEEKLYDFQKEVAYEYQQARRVGVELTKAEIAEILGEETGRKALGNMAAAAERDEIPLNKEQIQFAIDHQDELDAKTLLRIVPDEILRDELTPENFERVFKR